MINKKIFLVIGASSDVGVELIRQLNEDECNSIFLAHYNSSLNDLDKISMKNDNKIEFLQANLLDNLQVEKLIADIAENYEAPTHIVQLAAMKFQHCKLSKLEIERLQNNLQVQVFSIANILKKFLPIMAKRKIYNKVVFMLSSFVIGKPAKFCLDYNVTKFALLGLMKSVAADYEGKLININAISPSMIETKFLSEIDERIVEMNAVNSSEKRNAKVEDIVPVIKFLLSSESDYIHGVNFNVSNGNVFD